MREMVTLSTGLIDHGQLYDEARYIQEVLVGAGVKTVSICCAFGVDVDHPLFAKNVQVEIGRLTEFLRRHEDAETFHLGSVNITLTYDYKGLKFYFGNDCDVFCEGEESPQLSDVRERWAMRYPLRN